MAITRKSLSEPHYLEVPLEVGVPCSSRSNKTLTFEAFAGHEVGHGGLSTLIGAVAGGKSLSS